MAVMTVYYDRAAPTTVESLDELDTLLDRVAATPKYREFPVFVSIESADRRYVLQLGVGRTDLSALVWYDTEGDIAASSGTVGYDQRPRFNFGGTPTDAYDDSAVPVSVAREAAREFFTQPVQPGCVEWQEPVYSDHGEVVAHASR